MKKFKGNEKSFGRLLLDFALLLVLVRIMIYGVKCQLALTLAAKSTATENEFNAGGTLVGSKQLSLQDYK